MCNNIISTVIKGCGYRNIFFRVTLHGTYILNVIHYVSVVVEGECVYVCVCRSHQGQLGAADGAGLVDCQGLCDVDL